MRFLAPFLAVMALASSVTLGAFAQDAAPGADPHLRVLTFDPDRVVAIEGYLGYQMMIEFDPQERIEDVSIGDSVAWQVTPNHAATLLFLKPTEANTATNMTVVTNRRRYAFSLHARPPRGRADPGIVYTLRFTYPADQAPAAAANAPASTNPADFNFDYSIAGPRAVSPARVFDDGRFTYFQMSDEAETPAIFVLRDGNREETVNTQARGDYLVVDQVARVFSLRYGPDRAIVTNRRAVADGERAEHARATP